MRPEHRCSFVRIGNGIQNFTSRSGCTNQAETDGLCEMMLHNKETALDRKNGDFLCDYGEFQAKGQERTQIRTERIGVCVILVFMFMKLFCRLSRSLPTFSALLSVIFWKLVRGDRSNSWST
jgi:hypothetical protein